MTSERVKGGLKDRRYESAEMSLERHSLGREFTLGLKCKGEQ